MLFSIFAGQIYILGRNLNHSDNYGTVYLVLAVIRHLAPFVNNFFKLSSSSSCLSVLPYSVYFVCTCVMIMVTWWNVHTLAVSPYNACAEYYWRQFAHCEWRSTRVLLYRMLPFFAQRDKPKFKCNVLYRKVSSPKLDCSDRMCNLLARVSIQKRRGPQKLVFFHLLFNSCGPLKHKLVPWNLGQKI